MRCQRPRVALYGIEGEHKANGPSGGGLDLAVTSIIPMVYPPKARLVRRTYRGFIGLNRQESQPVVNPGFIARPPHFPLCAGSEIFSAHGVISELVVLPEHRKSGISAQSSRRVSLRNSRQSKTLVRWGIGYKESRAT